MMKTKTTHVLKIWREHYHAVADFSKPFEVRINDRDYQVGDTLILHAYDVASNRGIAELPQLERVVTSISTFQQRMNFVVLGFGPAANDGRDVIDAEVPELSASEAICAFAGLLTTLSPPVEWGSHATVYGLFEQARTFIGRNKLTAPREGWERLVAKANETERAAATALAAHATAVAFPGDRVVTPCTADAGAPQPFTFRKELERLINRHSIDNRIGTPDFMLALAVCRWLELLELVKTWEAEWRSPDGVPLQHQQHGPYITLIP